MDRRDLGGCLEGLERVAEAAERLGLDAGPARETPGRGPDPLRFPRTAFVCALAGGTSAGKSSLLNALAGRGEPPRADPAGDRRAGSLECQPTPPPARPVAALGRGRPGGQPPRPRLHRPVPARPARLRLGGGPPPGPPSTRSCSGSTPSAGCWTRRSTTTGCCTRLSTATGHHADRAVFVVSRRDVIGDARQIAALTTDLRHTLKADGISGRPVFVVSADPPTGTTSASWRPCGPGCRSASRPRRW